ncbi:MAG: DUF5060 domain-containing protein [bacterium]|nr:DUF5060 domain-containing protein [bacterium]
MRKFTWAASAMALLLLPVGAQPQGVGTEEAEAATVVWRSVDVVLNAQSSHPWWEFPVTAVFTHAASGERIDLEGFWDGGSSYRIRFAPMLAGTWNYRTSSKEAGLDGAGGTVIAREPAAAEVRDNQTSVAGCGSARTSGTSSTPTRHRSSSSGTRTGPSTPCAAGSATPATARSSGTSRTVGRKDSRRS